METSCAEQNLSYEITWIINKVKSGDQAVFEMKSLDGACGKCPKFDPATGVS